MLTKEVRNSVLHLTLNRPGKRNSLHPDLIAQLTETFATAGDDPSFNAILVTGAGPGFCAGLDLQYLLGLDGEQRVLYLVTLFDLFRTMFATPQPIVAAINGHAMAGGFDLAAFCDMRFCQPEAKFAQTEVMLGITQIVYPLYKIIGLGRAKELALTGAAIDAAEAYRIGLINRIFSADTLLDEVTRFAEQLAGRPREALFATKALANDLIEMPSQQAFTHMNEVLNVRLRSEEHRLKLAEYVDRIGIVKK